MGCSKCEKEKERRRKEEEIGRVIYTPKKVPKAKDWV